MAKKLRDEDLVLNIIVNGDRGKKEINQLERSIKDTRHELQALERTEKKLRAEGKKDTAQYNEVTAAIKRKNQALEMANGRLKTLRQGMDLSKMSLKDLSREMKRLRQLASVADPGTAQWKKHNAQLQLVKARYRELRRESEITGSTIRNVSSRVTRFFGGIAAGIATLAAVAFGIRRASEEFARFDDRIADVMKTTGLLKEDVLEIVDRLRDLEEIDTRTSEEGLLSLARIAGKLGIKGKENVLGFVKATDQIGVALTEDLGGDIEQSINVVGKLVDIFNVSEEFGIEEGLLKVGSVINELGASSSANEGFIVDFTKRVAGVAPAAKISIANIMGYGATLDMLGQSVEVSGTAVTQIITKMFEDTATFARIANMEVADFTKLLDQDANQAFIHLLEGVKGNDERMTDLVARLRELGIDGVRATNVVSVLANNTETLRNQQELANEAFRKGNSITDEFNIKNNTAAARLDKSKKNVSILSKELGERLFPVLISTNDVLSLFLKVLIEIFDFITEHWRVIVSLTTAIVTYNIAMKTSAISTRVATVAMRVFNAVTKMNPLGIFLSVLTAVGAYLLIYRKRLNAAEKAQESLNDIELEANKSIVKQRLEVERWLKVARNKDLADQERIKAIKKLNELSPEYLGNLNLETINTNKAKEATDQYVESLLKKARTQAAQNKLEELATRRLEIETGTAESELSFGQYAELAALTLGGNIALVQARKAQMLQHNLRDELEELKVEEDKIKEFINENFFGDGSGSDNGEGARNNNVGNSISIQSDKILAAQEKYLLSIKSLIEQEKAAHDERLKETGLFGRKRAEMTAHELQVLEALENIHRSNLAKIDADAIADDIDRKQEGFQRRLNELKVGHNEEIKQIHTLEQARAALEGELSDKALDQLTSLKKAKVEIRKKFQREEEELQKQHLESLMTQLQSLMNTSELEGLNLADKFLSEEEKELLEKRIDEIKLKLSELGLTSSTDEIEDKANEDDQQGFSIFGISFTPEHWKNFFTNLDDAKAAMKELQAMTHEVGNIWQNINEVIAQGEQQKLRAFETRTDKEKAMLQNQLERGFISQEAYAKRIELLNANLDQKKAQFARNDAKRKRNVALMSAIVDTAAAVVEALPSIPLAVLVGFLGAIQIAQIASTPLPEIPGREDGGFLDVRRRQDRKMFRAKYRPAKRGFVDEPTVITGENGREFVASNDAYNNPTIRPVLEAIDTAQKNGQISTVNLTRVLQDRPSVSLRGRNDGGFINEDPTFIGSGSAPGEDPELKELIRANIEATNRLNERLSNPIKADVSILGKNGFNEAMDELDDINETVNL